MMNLCVRKLEQCSPNTDVKECPLSITISFDETTCEARRYVWELCNLDKFLRKRFPRTPIPDLIVSSSAASNGKTLRKRQAGDLDEEFTDVDWQSYFGKLLSFHEIVASEELMHVFDPSISLTWPAITQKSPQSLHDYALDKNAFKKVVVRKLEECNIRAKVGQLVMWQFSTVNYDIGFSIEVNGVTKMPFTRIASHQKKMEGLLEINETLTGLSDHSSCTITLKWDNTYSVFHSKELTYRVGVIEVEDYQACRDMCMEGEKLQQQEKLKLQALKFEFHQMAVNLSSGLHYASTVPQELAIQNSKEQELLVQETIFSQQLQAELERYKEEVELLEEQLKEVEAAKASAEAARDSIYSSWKFTIQQWETSVAELNAAKSVNALFAEEKVMMQAEIDKLSAIVKEQQSQLLSLQHHENLEVSTDIDTLHTSMDITPKPNRHQLMHTSMDITPKSEKSASKTTLGRLYPNENEGGRKAKQMKTNHGPICEAPSIVTTHIQL